VEGTGGRLSGMGAGELETTNAMLGSVIDGIADRRVMASELPSRSRAEGGTTVEARIPGLPARLEGRPA
jgi:hypothetical protein